MRKIVIEIDCDERKCGNCHKIYEDSQNYLCCGQFRSSFKEYNREECWRKKACLAAEVKDETNA